MNFKYIFAFFLACTQLHALDITEEFCKTTKTPMALCAQIRASQEIFHKSGNTNTPTHRIELVRKCNQESIGSVELTHLEDRNVRLDSVKINPESQNGDGSLLWEFAFARCTLGDDRCKAGRVDITQEFCTSTQTPDSICSELQAFKKEIARAIRIDLVRKTDQEDIGHMDLKYYDGINALSIQYIKIRPQFQNQGNGSLLLKFPLAQCISTKSPCFLTAQNLWSQEATATYQKLKKFYQNHGLTLKREWPEDAPTTGQFAFYPKGSKEQ